jgi:vacuolar protein sorting-associated protein 11
MFVSQRPLSIPTKMDAPTFSLIPSQWNHSSNGNIVAVDIVPGIITVGTDTGRAFVYTYGGGRQHLLKQYLAIPPPPSNDMTVVACKLSVGVDKASLFVAYRRISLSRVSGSLEGIQDPPSSSKRTPSSTPARTTAGVSCYDMPIPSYNAAPISAPSARHDLDGRNVLSSSLCDAVTVPVDKSDQDNATEVFFTVARPDGLYTYNTTHKTDVAPIDGSKLAVCLVPPPLLTDGMSRQFGRGKSGSRFALVASTDARSHRDAVDIYDATNKLVAFHLLLSPGHKALCAAGVTTDTNRTADGSLMNGRSSAIVFTSGGSLVTMTEKGTAEKVHLLVQKNLYSAAIFVAYADPSYELEDIALLYRRHAEHLYRQADYSGAIEQYKNTIGSLEPSHVIFRYLDAPKIPLLVSYLEELRSRGVATSVHIELLRTCYLKLGDQESAETIAAFSSRSMESESLSISNMVTDSPKDALATICSFSPSAAAEALIVYGASLARLLPRETAGLAVSLCLGTFSPRKLSEHSSTTIMADAKKLLEYPTDTRELSCDPYPAHLFAPAFLENPKMLRLILATCNRNKCPLTPTLRRTLLELTLADWNSAKRNGDTEAEKLRRKEAIAALTDSHCDELGIYDALVIVQLAGFAEGEILLYERMQMSPMLLARYAKDGTEKARRQMLAMAQTEPETLADVLGYFVSMVSDRLEASKQNGDDGNDSDEEVEDILSDIQEALELARRQNTLPPVRVARILAGEGTGQFSTNIGSHNSPTRLTVPLAVALDYVGDVLDESRKECRRLRIEVEEYNNMCNSMEAEIESLLMSSSSSAGPSKEQLGEDISPRINVEDMYQKTKVFEDGRVSNKVELSREAFWREMDQTEDSFATIARFFSKGVIQ